MGDCVHAVSAYRSDNFVIGLTNVSTQQQPPVLYNYTVCGQYPGSVPSGATVSLRCNDIDLPPARYVIVQFPITDDYFNFCELNVCAKGLLFFLSAIVIVIFRSPKFWRFLYPPVQFIQTTVKIRRKNRSQNYQSVAERQSTPRNILPCLVRIAKGVEITCHKPEQIQYKTQILRT